jgi:hypothetical protein
MSIQHRKMKKNLSNLAVFCVMAAPAVSRSDSDPPDTQLGCSAIDALHGVNHATIKLFLLTRRKMKFTSWIIMKHDTSTWFILQVIKYVVLAKPYSINSSIVPNFWQSLPKFAECDLKYFRTLTSQHVFCEITEAYILTTLTVQDDDEQKVHQLINTSSILNSFRGHRGLFFKL